MPSDSSTWFPCPSLLAFPEHRLSPSQRLMLGVVAYLATSRSSAVLGLSERYLSAASGLKRSTCREGLKRLVAHGLLQSVASGTAHTPASYRVAPTVVTPGGRYAFHFLQVDIGVLEQLLTAGADVGAVVDTIDQCAGDLSSFGDTPAAPADQAVTELRAQLAAIQGQLAALAAQVADRPVVVAADRLQTPAAVPPAPLSPSVPARSAPRRRPAYRPTTPPRMVPARRDRALRI